MKAIPLVVPKETVSDDRYLYVESPKKDGDAVRTGEMVALLETSKSSFEIRSDVDGFIFFNKTPGTQVEAGDVLAWINSVAMRPEQLEAAAQKLPSASGLPVAEQRISKAAQALIEQNQLGMEHFKHLKTVSCADVLAVLAGQKPVAEGGQRPGGNRLLILGGGGHAKTCIDLLLMTGGWEIVGILDARQPIGSVILGVPVLDRDDDAALKRQWDNGVRIAVNGIGLVQKHARRHQLYERLKSVGFFLPNLIHPHHIAPGALLASEVSVASNTLIGMGCTIYLRARIGSNVVVANGTNIYRDVADNEVLHP